MNADPGSPVDLVSVLQRLGGDEELLSDVIQVFVEDFPAQLVSIASAIAGRDAGRLSTAAHALKDSAENLSAAGVARASHVLELIGQHGRTDAMDEAWTGLQTEAARLREALRTRRESGLIASTIRVLIADDDRVSRMILSRTLEKRACEVIAVADGLAAWDMIVAERPAVAILDWDMPGFDGPELCRRIRASQEHAHMYVLLLTAHDARSDLAARLEFGADDYLVKPVDPGELHTRIGVGRRVLALQHELAQRVSELEDARSQVRRLQGLLPICSYCKRIRTDQDLWQQIEVYVAERSDLEFSHGICPSCFERVRADWEQ